MKFIKRVGTGFKGFGSGVVSVPRDVRRYLAIRRM